MLHSNELLRTMVSRVMSGQKVLHRHGPYSSPHVGYTSFMLARNLDHINCLWFRLKPQRHLARAFKKIAKLLLNTAKTPSGASHSLQKPEGNRNKALHTPRMCVYVHILCVCMYIYIHMNVCIHVYRYVCIRTFACIHICMHIYTHVCVYVCFTCLHLATLVVPDGPQNRP